MTLKKNPHRLWTKQFNQLSSDVIGERGHEDLEIDISFWLTFRSSSFRTMMLPHLLEQDYKCERDFYALKHTKFLLECISYCKLFSIYVHIKR